MKKQGMFGFLKRLGLLVLVGGLVLGLAACGPRVPTYVKDPKVSNLSSYQRELLARLDHSDIQVIKQGARFSFVIPTDCFFNRNTRALKPHRDVLLSELALFVQSYTLYFTHPHVIVSGHTDKVWRYPERKLLSLHYAQSVADFLRQAGVDSPVLKVKGAGAKRSVASNKYPLATQFNRRVMVRVF